MDEKLEKKDLEGITFIIPSMPDNLLISDTKDFLLLSILSEARNILDQIKVQTSELKKAIEVQTDEFRNIVEAAKNDRSTAQRNNRKQ